MYKILTKEPEEDLRRTIAVRALKASEPPEKASRVKTGSRSTKNKSNFVKRFENIVVDCLQQYG